MTYAATVARVAARAVSERDRMRSKFPELATFIDQLRESVPEARVTYVRFADGEERGVSKRPVPVAPIKMADVIQQLKDEAIANARNRQARRRDR